MIAAADNRESNVLYNAICVIMGKNSNFYAQLSAGCIPPDTEWKLNMCRSTQRMLSSRQNCPCNDTLVAITEILRAYDGVVAMDVDLENIEPSIDSKLQVSWLESIDHKSIESYFNKDDGYQSIEFRADKNAFVQFRTHEFAQKSLASRDWPTIDGIEIQIKFANPAPAPVVPVNVAIPSTSGSTLPQDFRKIPIAPENSDILDGRSERYLQKNIVDGKYASVDQYLDLHFRLTREDYIKILRDVIIGYRQMTENEKQKSNIARNVEVEKSINNNNPHCIRN